MPQKEELCDRNACIVAVKQKLPLKVVIRQKARWSGRIFPSPTVTHLKTSPLCVIICLNVCICFYSRGPRLSFLQKKKKKTNYACRKALLANDIH